MSSQRSRRISLPIPGSFRLIEGHSPYNLPEEEYPPRTSSLPQTNYLPIAEEFSTTPYPPRTSSLGETSVLNPIAHQSVNLGTASSAANPTSTGCVSGLTISPTVGHFPKQQQSTEGHISSLTISPLRHTIRHVGTLDSNAARRYLDNVTAVDPLSRTNQYGTRVPGPASVPIQNSFLRSTAAEQFGTTGKTRGYTDLSELDNQSGEMGLDFRRIFSGLSISRKRRRADDDDDDEDGHDEVEEPGPSQTCDAIEEIQGAKRSEGKADPPKNPNRTIATLRKARTTVFRHADNASQIFANFVAAVKLKQNPDNAEFDKFDRLIFHGEKGAKDFRELMFNRRMKLKTVVSLHLVINANDWSPLQDDNFATALRFFAKPASHRLKEFSITVIGNTLFTAKNFIIAPGLVRSQAMKQSMGVSDVYSCGWKKLYEGNSTRESNRAYPPKYRTSEKTIVSAILELRNIKKVTIMGAMEWDLKLDILRNFGIDPESAEMLPPIHLQPELGIDFGGANPSARHSRMGFFSTKAQGKQKVPYDAEPAHLQPIQEDPDAITAVGAESNMSPAIITESALPFSRDSEGRYALRSRNAGHASNCQSTNPQNSGATSNKRRKTDHHTFSSEFTNNPIENLVVDTSASPPLRTSLEEEWVRISAHRCEPKIWDDSKYLSVQAQIQEGSLGECALGWKVVWIPEKKHWIVGREDEYGTPATFL